MVALDPHTGAVKVMASYPQFDPGQIATSYPKLASQPGAPLLNRATQGQYPPGSSFKVLTDVAAIDTGRFSPDSTLNGDSPKTISGVPLSNDGGQSFGDIPLTDALTNVCVVTARPVGRTPVAVVRGILDAGGDIREDWELTKAFATGDRSVGVNVLLPLYERMKDKSSPADLDSLWNQLGIRKQDSAMQFDDSSPLAAIRKSITEPRQTKN